MWKRASKPHAPASGPPDPERTKELTDFMTPIDCRQPAPGWPGEERG